jgi:PRTRC genetic system protein E
MSQIRPGEIQMFKELVPILRHRAVLMTVTLLEEDEIRVNVVPKKLKDGDNDALSTPLSVTGTAEELDAQLSSTLVNFSGAHLQLKNTLEKAKAEMDAAAKTAQAEARSKAKKPARREPAPAEGAKPVDAAKPIVAAKPESPKTASLFDVQPATTAVTTPTVSPSDEEEDEDDFAQIDEDSQPEEDEGFDEAA